MFVFRRLIGTSIMPRRHLPVICLLGLGCLVAVSAEGAKPKNKPAKVAATQTEPDPPAPAKKITYRLPNNYGKLGLTAEQKNAIYSIQARHNGQINTLEEQIRQLKEQRDAEIAGVLSDSQREKLNSLADAKRKKANPDEGQDTAKNGNTEE